MSKVAIVKCRSYNEDDIENSLNIAFDLLSEDSQESILKRIVFENSTVLLKPNMLGGYSPEEGVNTHPNVIKVVAKLVKEAGGNAIIGDSPSFAIKGIEQVWEKSGFKNVADSLGIDIINFEKDGLMEVDVPQSTFFEKLFIAKQAFHADIIINLPKLKTHTNTILTGAIKNLLGLVPGFLKAEFHRRAHRPSQFGVALSEILSVIKPSLNIMDAIVGMEGNGPTAGKLRIINLLLVSTDPVALDAVFANLVWLNPLDIPTIYAAYQKNLGEADLKNIEIVGIPLNKIRLSNFILPKQSLLTLLPSPIVKILANLIRIRPLILEDKCSKCKLCITGCPVKAISWEKEKININYNLCIECFCCHEFCPNRAIKLKETFSTFIYFKILGLMSRIRKLWA
ncbi:MAG: DUF362 domain-containing protein [bacterium]|nr:DUF362 domain-containing protein [bacterium]